MEYKTLEFKLPVTRAVSGVALRYW